MTVLAKTVEDLRGRRAARWIRESTASQYDRFGPAAQRQLQDVSMARLGLVDSGIAWEPAHSGATVWSSAAMASMRAAALAGQFDVLVVAYLARWQRNLRRTLEVLEDDLHPVGVAVWFCDEEILSSNERHWDQLVDEAKAAESWLRKHRRRVTEGLASKLREQRDPGGHPPFGFRRNAAKLIEPDPEHMPTAVRVFSLSASGLADRDVAREVGLGLYTVRGMLTSPLYLGRLRDGGPASWPSQVDRATWEMAQDRRAHRATNAGRPAAPTRPYALSMLHCGFCGRRLIGDTAYYRHREVCLPFADAKPQRAPGQRGRIHGKAYRRELYEDAIAALLDQVSLGANVLSRVVAAVSSPTIGADRLALRRIEQERDGALTRYRRDRETEALERTMARLDREELEARRERVPDGVPAEVAVRYLRELPETWRRADGGPGRRMLAEALFERIEAKGFRELTVHLTEAAVAHGFAAALPQKLDLGISGYGRGERT